MEDVVAGVVSRVVGIPTTMLDRTRPMVEMIDSLMSIEIKNQLESRLKLDVPLSQLLGGDSILNLAIWLKQSAQHESSDNTVSTESLGLSPAEMAKLAVLPNDLVVSSAVTVSEPLNGVLLT